MSFCEDIWAETAALRAAIHALPFNRELAAGTLDPDRFRFYVVQDALYLAEYARALALAATRAEDGEAFKTFADGALEAVAVEQTLHGTYLRQFGIDPASLATAEPTPDCLGYTSFLLATAYHAPWEVLVAALLPCFWLYWDVGRAITTRAAPDNPYRAWIDTYADEAYGAAVQRVIAITDEAAAAASPALLARMRVAFIRCCQWEWLFWDGAYQRRTWPAPA